MEENRRPISSRSSKWANAFAKYLASKSITPNQISILSIFFALFGTLCLIYLQDYFGFILCIVFIQARLLCNLFDGMVAIEGGKKTASGAIFNEFPDRIADTLLLLGMGYASSFETLAWLASLLALATAYIRVFASSLNLEQNFMGPMAKQHRMAVMSVACLIAQFEWLYSNTYHTFYIALWFIIVGCIITCYRRTAYLIKSVKN